MRTILAVQQAILVATIFSAHLSSQLTTTAVSRTIYSPEGTLDGANLPLNLPRIKSSENRAVAAAYPSIVSHAELQPAMQVTTTPHTDKLVASPPFSARIPMGPLDGIPRFLGIVAGDAWVRVSPQPHGADNTASLQRLLFLGKWVTLAPGIYPITSLTLPAGAHISGSGTLLDRAGTKTMLRVTGVNVSISGIGINQNGQGGYIINAISPNNLTITGVTLNCNGPNPFCINITGPVSNFVFSSNHVTAGSTPVLLTRGWTNPEFDSNDVTVIDRIGTNRQMSGLQTGLVVTSDSCRGARFTNNRIHVSGTYAVGITAGGAFNSNSDLKRCTGELVEHNYVEFSGNATQGLGLSITQEDDATVTHNIVEAHGNEVEAGYELPNLTHSLVQGNKCSGCSNTRYAIWLDLNQSYNRILNNCTDGFSTAGGIVAQEQNPGDVDIGNEIAGNTIYFSNDTAASNKAAISLWAGSPETTGVINNVIHDNYIFGYSTQANSTGIYLGTAYGTSANNVLRDNSYFNLAYAYNFGSYIVSGRPGTLILRNEKRNNVRAEFHPGSARSWVENGFRGGRSSIRRWPPKRSCLAGGHNS